MVARVPARRRAMPASEDRTLTVTFTEQQLQVVDQLLEDGRYGSDRHSVIKRLLALYAQERLSSGAGAAR
jgi:Arc/MetJ-type ribon-helix-helix transcriptional regulator